ncbi:MAG: carboxypeptidase M32 [Chloroflexota bacterium]
MGNKYNALLEQVHEIHDLEKVTWLLSWDREVIMPSKGNIARTQQLSTINKLHHNLFTSDEMGALIESASEELEQEETPYDTVPSALVRWLSREYKESRKIPADFVKRRDILGGNALPAWKEARETNNFALFAPHLTETIKLSQELAEYRAEAGQAAKYDALLSAYERGITTAEVKAIFDQVKAETKPLIEAISQKSELVDDSFLHQPYPIDVQKEVAPHFAKAVGYDFSRGHLGTATHPFASSFSRNDARITTRWYPEFINPALFGVMHESGHAIYEQGTSNDVARTPLARGTSMGIHESQSRMMENLVGRSAGFWEAHFPVLQNAFPEQLGTVSAERFYQAVNKVQPSYIRVEADELTYNMHIILRFELEQEMVEGHLQAKDLPDAWNAKMKELLGIMPPDDRLGCLQDIHWTRPSFGYFPTYALGNLYAVQLLEAAQSADPQIKNELEKGQVTSLKRWLGENVHRYGRMFDPPELIQRITGRSLTPEPFIGYVQKKFGAIYQLDL